ncbi:hypothetical protein EMIHUDRAFT_206069 [Emiliania huxleyi CCMP1516]|uniref:Uncharacterized protein n=2 Tax=Emiliania huxleyi TaxID=2903 RepID=A0A0D3JQT3_EMIH1|nr:hypothetical protein EMIHUDRAFT_206069 [Emiliania huxleyi CCMP1516]EOD25868.1 hypothetical protein EMIHUDRAFT_206069 [Emiliania huxleyi CCMP1516]|eukprot:XP_005778297.1 hypothetical protein EMIHUDRAFT_206069 [Emiliania huxleyi CCMP1516]
MENATFPLQRGAENGGGAASGGGTALIVDGTFITEVHLVALVGHSGTGDAAAGMGAGSSSPRRKWLNVSYWAAELNENNWGWTIVTGYCGGRLFKIGKGGQKVCEDVTVSVRMTTGIISSVDWTVTVQGSPTHATRGPTHRADVGLSANGEYTSRSLPHGIFGQSFSALGPLNGKRDGYPRDGPLYNERNGPFMTSAMAEGAIEGKAADYELPSAFATRFAFSRFDESLLPPSTDGLAVGVGSTAGVVVEASAGAEGEDPLEVDRPPER